MVAPLIGLAIGLGFQGLQELGKRKQKKIDTDVLSAITSGSPLGGAQAGPPTPQDLLSGFSQRQQNQIGIVGQSDPAEALTLARGFALSNAQAQQQQFANAATTSQLQNQLQTQKLAGKRFDLDFSRFAFDRAQSAKVIADNELALRSPEFAAKKAAKEGKPSYSVWDPLRQTFGTAWLPGEPQFIAAEGAIVTTTQSLELVSQLREMVRNVDPTGDPASLNTRRLDAITTTLQLQFKDLAKLGVISETDFTQFIAKIVPGATSVKEAFLSNPQAIDQALVQFTIDIQNANKTAVQNVSGWQGIRPELIQDAALAQETADAQNQVSALELTAEQARTRQLKEIGIGATTLDEQLLANSAILRAITGDTGQAQSRLDQIREAGLSAGLVDPGLLRQLGAGIVENAGQAFNFLGGALVGRSFGR